MLFIDHKERKAASCVRYRQLIGAAKGKPPIRTVVVHPCDELSLVGALDADVAGLIVPILVGPVARMDKAAEAARRSLNGIELVDAPHSHAAADLAVARGCRHERFLAHGRTHGRSRVA